MSLWERTSTLRYFACCYFIGRGIGDTIVTILEACR